MLAEGRGEHIFRLFVLMDVGGKWLGGHEEFTVLVSTCNKQHMKRCYCSLYPTTMQRRKLHGFEPCSLGKICSSL